MVATAPKLCRKCDFFLEKRLKESFAYVLEIMLTIAKMHDLGPNCFQKTSADDTNWQRGKMLRFDKKNQFHFSFRDNVEWKSMRSPYHTGKCIRRFAGIYAYCRYFIDRKW